MDRLLSEIGKFLTVRREIEEKDRNGWKKSSLIGEVDFRKSPNDLINLDVGNKYL